jgi:putative nucleotidyltransferase with HDIG domain
MPPKNLFSTSPTEVAQRMGRISIPGSKFVFFAVLIPLYFSLLWMVAKPYFGNRYTYELGEIVQENIVSTKDITYINRKETEKRVEDVRRRVAPVFELQLLSEQELGDKLQGYFAVFETSEVSQHDVDELYRKHGKGLSRESFEDILKNSAVHGYQEKVQGVLSKILARGFSSIKREELNRFADTGIILKRIYESEITVEQVEVERIVAEDELDATVSELLSNDEEGLTRRGRTAILELSRILIEPNLRFNAEESQRLLKEEINKVEPVMNTIKKGAVVIRRGEEVTEDNYPKLRAITLQTSRFNLKAIVGLGIVLLILLYITLFLLLEEVSSREMRDYFVFAGFLLFTVFYAYLITLIKNLPEHIMLGVLVPIAGITMTAEVLFRRRFSLILATVIPIFLLLISGNDAYTFLFLLGSGLIAIFAVRTAEKRSDLLSASFFIVITNELLLTSIGLLRELAPRELLNLLIWGIGNGIVSVVFSLGIIPFFEVILNLPTNFRLLELSDLNTPIMKKMQIEAPGTYHHSINVANMAEAAARAVKANALLVRVASLYHDIGKIPNAEYYIENNPGESKHNFIKPSLSNSILKAHIKIGVEMAKDMKMPAEVLDIIAQHHGTSLMKYFYHQALQSSPESEIDKKDYHYQGPKPQNREAAIVMLADSVEAASRTLKNPSAARIEEFVQEIIEGKFREGQLNESTLTLRGLMKISIAFRRYLTGVFHSRIEYPDDKEIEFFRADKA